MANSRESLALGRQKHDAGQLESAERIYREILQAEPRHVETLQLLGVLLLQRGRPNEAVALFEFAVSVAPRDSQLRSNLGAAYSQVGRQQDALATVQRAIELAPDYPEARYNLGLVLFGLGRLEEAVSSYRDCLRLNPDFTAAHRNLGVALRDLARLDEARQCFERARQLEPNQPVSHVNLGTVLKDQGELQAALDCYETALRLDPGNAQAIISRATLRLAMGQFTTGWADYEHRIGSPDYNTLVLDGPRWDGADLAGRILLIHCEQGLGDTLHFIRYVKLVRQRGGQIVVAAQPALIPLLSESGFGPVVSRNEPLIPYQVHAPLLSLPYIYRTQLDTIPREVPYLTVNQQRVERWREEVHQHRGFKIGIAWQGQPKFRADRLRSIPLHYFTRLAEVPGTQLISLQKGHGSEQLASLDNRYSVIDLANRLDEAGAFLDTAAVMQCLDLVVTTDTATAHLAGALGVPVWVALSSAPDWRWLLDRTDSPWYPTMRLFRQREAGQWQGVFDDMAAELVQLWPRSAS